MNKASASPVKVASVFLLLGITGLGGLLGYDTWKTNQLNGPTAPEATPIESLEEDTNLENLAQLNLEMTFYAQAPNGNWDYPWQEACEEASIALVANSYLEKNWDRSAFNEELLRLVDWEMEAFGAYEHTNVEQTVEMIKENYGLETRVVVNPSFEDLESAIQAGHFIVAPLAGKLLDNPNFTNGGPIYHMIVLKGYDREKQEVVTHEVGTRNGEDYVYSWAVIENALHDWNSENIELGTKQWIEVYPPSAQ